MLQNLFPIRRIIVSPQVRLQLARQNLQRSALSNTVCSHQSQHLPRSWQWQSVQLEAVGAVAVCDLCLEVGGQVDDVDGVEWTLLGTDTTSDA